jgi:hypothetical protein
VRNARFPAAIGLHTSGATVDPATKLFEENRGLDAANARPQAVRDTYDLGTPMIRNRRAWFARHPGSALDFHDTFLSHGCAPVPHELRELMLAEDSSPLGAAQSCWSGVVFVSTSTSTSVSGCG